MSGPVPERVDAMLDGLAYLQATAEGDEAGRRAVALNCDPALMVDAIAEAAIELADSAVVGGASAWLAALRRVVVERRGDET
ncbi:hypothetical protein [Gordonia sp. N1V]|uniref:hypothetical protein n=1 Tax=Gordonia sp. N1V TaxID=3034163 RepID=UPI0023E2D25D|nr:hypothetical protein [Gordonia sp. N1V]MDF3283370.1 hypothetical protein [Gordonia sp. N1V]